MDHNLVFVIVQFHVPLTSQLYHLLVLSPYRPIARIGGANYDNPEGERRWAICVKYEKLVDIVTLKLTLESHSKI